MFALYKMKGKIPSQIAKNMGPTWVLSAPDGSHVGPMNRAIRDVWVDPSGIKFFQLWRSSRHSRLPHGREQQSIEQLELPAGRM